MPTRKWMAALLALCLLLALIPAATTESADDLLAIETDDIADGAALEVLPAEADETPGEDGGLLADSVDLPSFEIETPAAEAGETGGERNAPAANATQSLVRITKPADGATVKAGKVNLWCTFVNDNPNGGFSAGDAWKYVPMKVQVLRGGEELDLQYVSNYSTLWFTDEGANYADVSLYDAGTYTIRVSVPGSPELWDSITVKVEESSATPAPATTRTPITDDTLVVITSPEHNARLSANEKIPVRVKLRKPASGLWTDVVYAPIRIEVLGSRGNLVWATEVGVDDIEYKLNNGTEWTLAEPSVEIGGNYTIRVRADGSSTWDSVQVYADGPSTPPSKEAEGYTVTPGVSSVTIDLGENDTARIPFTLCSGANPEGNFIYYADFVEEGDEIIKYKRMYDYSFVKSGASWIAEGWIEYTGVKVGTATLHMYLLLNGTRFGHQAVTVNVIDSSKISVTTPTPSPKPTSTPKPKPTPKTVKLNKTGTVKLKMGKTLTLKAKLTPKNAETKLTWKSSDKKIATVKGGVVTPVKPGTATITVKTANKLSAKVKVEVTAVKPTAVNLNKTGTVKLKKGKTLQLKAKLTPSYATSKLKWTSSKKKVAKVSSKGKVTALKKGKAIITVTTENDLTAQVEIQVK